MESCSICGQPVYTFVAHRCPPKWEVRDTTWEKQPYYHEDEEWRVVFAPNEREAACIWLQEYNQAQSIWEEETRIVRVRKFGETESYALEVRMSLAPAYEASFVRSQNTSS